jgi:small-conductance mechanosensitive channel
MTYSDRTLLQRAIAALVVTGGAIGFAIGIGLQKIGSNLVSGIMLLISKPIRRDDVIAFEKGYTGRGWGWIARMDLMYVHLDMRSESLLPPNAIFLTQKIENLSYNDNRIGLNIPFGIAYESDLNKAKTLAVSAAAGIDRILKIPEPKYLVVEYGDSTVNLDMLVWIDDPKNGIVNIKDAVMIGIWGSFHASGITIAFPQRDLYMKSAVPLKIYKNGLPQGDKNSPTNKEQKDTQGKQKDL